MNWCAMKLPLAVRLLHLLKLREVDTPDSAVPYFTESELCYLEHQEMTLLSPNSKRIRPPKRSLSWAILMISILGGYKATPSANPPGQTVLWRGLDKLTFAGHVWFAAQDSGD